MDKGYCKNSKEPTTPMSCFFKKERDDRRFCKGNSVFLNILGRIVGLRVKINSLTFPYSKTVRRKLIKQLKILIKNF